MNMSEESSTMPIPSQPSWNAVFAVALGVSSLITSEFLPVSLLTPMAKDLGITEGLAGQAISVTAIVALFTSLLIATATQRLDRRWILSVFCVLQIISNLFVAYAPNFALLLVGRALLGVGLGGLGVMSAAAAMRLVPENLVPKALSIVYGAVSFATVIAAPLGSYLGSHIGWRNVFLVAAAIGVIALACQFLTLPAMPAGKPARLSTLLHVLRRPNVKEGMLATMFVFIGHAVFFTYLRPFLETVTGVNSNTLSAILLGFGIANLAGATFSRYLLEWNIYRSLSLMPLLMSVVASSLVVFGQFTFLAAVLVALWGMSLGIIQVGWIFWITKTMPDEVESGSGIQMAVIQLAITAGAAIGGVAFDFTGAKGVFTGSCIFTLVAATAAILAFKKQNKDEKKNLM
jgi:predicted MFS family arabinose efflux permease